MLKTYGRVVKFTMIHYLQNNIVFIIIINITYKDRRTNIWVKERAKLIYIYIIYTVRKNEMVLGRAYQPPQRRPMDLARHHLETIII